MPTFYIPLAQANRPPPAPGQITSGTFNDPTTGAPIAIPQTDGPNILQRWTLLSIYAPFAIVVPAPSSPVNFQLGISALINETAVWAQQANGQMYGTAPAASSQVVAGDLFNPLELNAGQKLTFAWQLATDAALGFTVQIYLGASYGANGIQPVPGVVNYDVAYDPALPGRAT